MFSSYFSLLFSGDNGGSIFLYTIIFFVSFLLASKSQKVVNGNYIFQRSWFFITFLFLWIFFALNDVGADTEQYRSIFSNVTNTADISQIALGVEPGYQFLNYLVHFLTNNPVSGVAIIRTLQLALVFLSFYLLRDEIDIKFAVMAYVAFFYFSSFNILRSSLAGSVGLISFALLYRKKDFLAFILAIVGFSFHNSFALFIITLILCELILKIRLLNKNVTLIVIIAFVALLFVLNVGADYINFVLNNSDFNNGRYEGYASDTSAAGLFVVFKYVPVFYSLYLLGRSKIKSEVEKRWLIMNLVYVFAGFAIAVMGYQIGMLTRTAIYFGSAYLFLIPSSFYRPGLISRKSFKIVIFIFLTMMYMINISGYLGPDQLSNFHFVK